MDRQRLAYATMAVLGVVCLAMVAGVLYPLSTAEPTPADEHFEVGHADSYRVAANISTDGEISLGVVGAVSDSGARYARTVGQTTTESYQNASREENVVYERTVAEGEQAERLLEHRRDARDVEIVSESWDGETLTMLAIDRSDDAGVDPTGATSVVASSMRLARYESADSAGGSDQADDQADNEADASVLEPRSGWYDGGGPDDSRTYRLTDVSGEVTVDPETNVLTDARVEWTLTNPADTYVHYLLARASDGAVGQTYDYTYEPGDVAVERPAWVERLQETS